MKKNKKTKNKIYAGLLALTLAFNTPVLVKGEEQVVKTETQTELIQMFQTDYEITDLVCGEVTLNKYVSEDGKIEKWYSSYLPEIDGLKRTNETKIIKSAMAVDNEPCDIKQYHTHQYFHNSHGLLTPFVCGEDTIYFHNNSLYKTIFVSNENQEVLDILHEFEIYRISDNAFLYNAMMNNISQKGGIGIAGLQIESLDDSTLITNVVPLMNNGQGYDHETMNGLLLSPVYNAISIEYLETLDEEKKVKVYKNQS